MFFCTLFFFFNFLCYGIHVLGEFKLLVLHTNDMHSRFEQTNYKSQECEPEEAEVKRCIGGFGRLRTAAQELKQKAESQGRHVLFLNAGDTFVGTGYYFVHHWKVVAKFIDLIGLDVMCLGNHEFDEGVENLVKFLKNISTPAVACNIDLSEEEDLQIPELTSSLVLNVNGTDIGIIGYVTPQTKTISKAGGVIFLDEVACVSREAAKLKAKGVNILIALGHSGFEMDLKIAQFVPDLDLVVGGHSNTFLYTGKDHPDTENPVGYYPTIVTQSSGRKVPVVQAYAYTKYLGYLLIDFKDDGEMIYTEGNPILLNHKYEQAPEVQYELEYWREKVEEKTREKIGVSKVQLDGDNFYCRLRECNLGNLVTDAIIDYNAKLYNGEKGWTDAPISMISSGAIRKSVELEEDVMTLGDIMTALPYNNEIYKIQIRGQDLLQALEWNVAKYNTSHKGWSGCFLQISGMQVTYNITEDPGNRVVSIKLRCGACKVPRYTPLVTTKVYTVLTSKLIAEGGDGYTIIKQKRLAANPIGVTDTKAIMEYVIHKSPIYPEVSGRITILGGENENY
ncbi:protein 5NUC-like [Lycorma delicatula]|uniref:protein 5NUC-like n=1 Tax=Lycorma delicatula TaxID=130591 RepID=UPI003F51A675